MSKASKSKAMAAPGDISVSDDAVVMASIGGASFVQVVMAMTPQQRAATVVALHRLIELVHEAEGPKGPYQQITLRGEEAERLERVARHYNLTVAQLIRTLLKREDSPQ